MSNAQVVRDSIDVIWNRGELNRLAEFYNDDFIWHRSGTGSVHEPGVPLFEASTPTEWVPGFSGVERIVSRMRTTYPDYHEAPELVVEEGDLVAVRQTVTGTNTGPGAFPPTNRAFQVTDTMICRVSNGKLAEQWGLFDQYSLIIQLGLHQLAQPHDG